MAEAKENLENATQQKERQSKRKLTVVLPSVMSRVRKAVCTTLLCFMQKVC